MLTEEKSEMNLATGLTMVGKVMYNIREWTGKFAQQQHKHQYPLVDNSKSKLGAAFKRQMNKFKVNVQQCSLCLTQKPKNQFHKMCKCHHEYCYNCLNTYAISRIQDQDAVVCPQQDCTQTLPLSSYIYKYLPDDIKVKYLNNRHARKKQNIESLCPRCLQQKHPGQCKYALKPAKIQYAYHYRQCSNCKTQVNMTQGKRKINCQKCGHKFCYFCGSPLNTKQDQNHVCGSKGQRQRLQKQLGEKAAASCASCTEACCSCQCCQCSCCQCEACRNCDGDLCCQVCFYCDCDQFNPFCCLWNIFSIPFRFMISGLVIMLMLMLFSMYMIVPITLLFFALLAGFTCGWCQMCSEQQNKGIVILMIIFYPFFGFVAAFVIMQDACQAPIQAYTQMLTNVWVQCSPKQCT